MLQKNEWIAARAYQLWEQAGRPDGQDGEHWRDASRQWDDQEALPSTPNQVHHQSNWDEEGED